MQTYKGLALQDILTEVHLFVIRMQLSAEIRIDVLDKLAEMEYRLSTGTSEKINLGALVGTFQRARAAVLNESQN